MTTTHVDSTIPAMDATQVANILTKLTAFTPKEPDTPASEGQIALLTRFGVKTKRTMTKGDANRALTRFFTRNPLVAVEFYQERQQRARDSWAARVKEFAAVAEQRSQVTCRVPPTEKQISAVMAVAYIRRDVTDGQRMEAVGMLDYGAGRAMISAFLNTLPQRADQQPAAAN